MQEVEDDDDEEEDDDSDDEAPDLEGARTREITIGAKGRQCAMLMGAMGDLC